MQRIFAKINTCEIWEIILGSFCFYFQISWESSFNIDKVTLILFSSKVSFIVLWHSSFKKYEWNLLLQFPKYCKTGKIKFRPCLISATPRISPWLSENVIVPSLQVPPKKYVHRLKLGKPMLDGRKTWLVDRTVQQILSIVNMNLKKLVQAILTLYSNVFKIV